MKPTAIDRRPSTQDITWFLDLYRQGQLDLDPPYQRRSVWSPSDRRYFLDTIFRGYPSPPVYLHKETKKGGKTVYAVVDGKQRLETIIRFAENKIRLGNSFGDSRLDGMIWKKILKEKDSELPNAFWDYVIPVEFISVSEGPALLNEVFDRLNRNSRKLVEQELRHARYDGWFIDFVEEESEDPDWADLEVATRARAKRMRDVQFLSELLIVLLKNGIGGFDQKEIDEFCANYENPIETVPSFDETGIKKRWTSARRYLMAIEKEGSIVTKHAKDFVNLYTLWALVVLNADKLPAPKAFAKKYSKFMADVAKLQSQDYLERVLKKEAEPEFPQTLKYYQNSIGASTELPQRQARLAQLADVMIG